MRTISDKLFHRPSVSKKTLIALALLVVWSLFLLRALYLFRPDVNSAATFNSDCAVPILMSNDDRPVTLFNLYYYGTDRWGGWPFLVARLVRRTTGYTWSDQSLSMMQTFWVFIGALVIAGLSRKDRAVVAVVYLVTLCLHGETRYQIFLLSQVYAWQVTSLLLGWYSLRRLFGNGADSEKRWRSSRAVWLFLSFFFSYLAVWSSIASIPLLIFLVCVEALRVRLKRESGRGTLRMFVTGLIPVLAGVLLERLQKMDYHRYADKRYGFDFRSKFELDTGYLTKNLGIHFESIIKLAWWPLHLLATLALLAALCAFAYALLKKKGVLLGKLKAVFADDTVILIVGAYGIALINFVLTVIVSHVRLNDYDDRYLTLTSLFGPVSGMLTLFLIIRWCARRGPHGEFAAPAFTLALLILLAAKFPSGSYRPEYRTIKDTALALAEKSPRAILMGGYWETYVFAGLQPVNTMTPVPLEGQENRMPWTREMVRRADHLVVEYRKGKLGEGDEPPQHLNQYGNSLRLADAKWYENGEYAFALYVKED